ncbi:MAG: hypothetical protein ABI921_09275 [Panacibacter sp.]
MKRNICFLFFLLPCFAVYAQLNTTISVQSSPTAVLSEWYGRNSVVTFVVTKIDSAPQQVIFKTEIKLTDGTVIATTDLSRAIPVTLSRGTKVYFSKDVMPLENMIITGRYKAILDRTGKLPAGNYQLCVQLIGQGAGGLQPLVASKCGNFNMVAFQLPVLMMPANNAILNKSSAQTAIIFRWTPLIPSTSNLVTYRLQIFEILPEQKLIQALRGNQPLLDITVKAITQYTWQPRMSFNTTDSLPARFIWTLQTLDVNGQPILQTDGNGESRSEPFIFSVVPGTTSADKKKAG